MSGALAEAATFEARRPPLTLVLAELTTALPADAAITALRVDTVTTTMVVLAPRAASILAQLERVPTITGAELVGPVTREMVGARELERVTIRFRLTGSREMPSTSPARPAHTAPPSNGGVR